MGISPIKPVKYDEIVGHFHIGANMPGYLPESDVYCAPTLGDAIDVWEDQIDSLEVDDGEEYSRILAVKSALKDKDVHRNALVELEKFRAGKLGKHLANLFWFIHTPDEGPDMNMWVSVHEDSRRHCFIAQDQGDEEYADVQTDDDGTEVEIIDEDAGDGTETEVY